MGTTECIGWIVTTDQDLPPAQIPGIVLRNARSPPSTADAAVAQ